MELRPSMDNQENHALPQGEALNAAVAQYVMGYRPIFDSILGELWIVEDGSEPVDTPPFTASADEANAVIRQIRERQLEEIFLRHLAELQQTDSPNGAGDLEGYLSRHRPTLEQICQAALLSVKRKS